MVEWLLELKDSNAKRGANWWVRIEQLAEMGYELRRPAADFLRDGIYELRANKVVCSIAFCNFSTEETSPSRRIV